MTTVYFIRHAQPNKNNHDDLTRELTAQGMEDRKQVTAFLLDKQITAVFSSPYKRAVDTVKHFADSVGLTIQLDNDFRERKVAETWITDLQFSDFTARQWADFSYKFPTGECLREVQARNIAALNRVLTTHAGQNIVIGTHGTALGTILAYYDSAFGYEQFLPLLPQMPFMAQLQFDGLLCVNIKLISL